MQLQPQTVRVVRDGEFRRTSRDGTTYSYIQLWGQNDLRKHFMLKSLRLTIDPMKVTPESLVLAPPGPWLWQVPAWEVINRMAVVVVENSDTPGTYNSLQGTSIATIAATPNVAFNKLQPDAAQDSPNILLTGQWRTNGWLRTEQVIQPGNVNYSMYIGEVTGTAPGATGTVPFYIPTTNPSPATIEFNGITTYECKIIGGESSQMLYELELNQEINDWCEIWMIIESLPIKDAGTAAVGDWVTRAFFEAEIQAVPFA